jgi:raffinose/stachyose/melibiose transport system substrate-binding protein
MKSWKLPATAIVGAILLSTLSGCAPGGAASAPTSETPSKDLGSEKVTLTVVTTPESGRPLDKIIAAFEKKHPNITVKNKKTTFDDYNKQLPLQLASNSSPDLALINFVGNMAKDKLLLPLNPYKELYGWDQVYSPGELGDYSMQDNLVGSGGSDLVALPTSFYLVGVYYNKDLAKQAGITVPPTSYDEFVSDLAKAKAAGLLPLQFGNAQGHAGFTIQEIGQSIDGADTARDWVWGKAGNSFDTPGNRKGVQSLVEWNKAGYFPPATEVNGTDLADAVGKFASGKGTFFIDGNWDAATITKAMGDNAGFFTFPGKKATGAGGSAAYAISAKSKHPNAAAAFLDFFHSPEASQAEFESGFLPKNVSALTAPDGSVMNDILTNFGKVSADNGGVDAYANATASMNDTLTKTTQDLLSGATDPNTLITTVQADWAKNHG